MSSFHQPDFLTDRDHPRYRVRCPIHGFIHFSRNERQVIDHPIFQRLRFIRQLALTDYVYPGAAHSRFEHSLGVMELGGRAFDRLAERHGDLLESRFSQVEVLGDNVMAKARAVVRLAALLHDVGHTSFSHAAESVVFNDGETHETFGWKLIREPDLLGNLIDKLYWPGCAQLTTEVLEGIGSLAPQLLILHDIVSGQIDADRSDYLLRDSHHCGVDYGRFDYPRLIECLALVVDEDLGQIQMAIQRGGLYAFEALLLARYQMNTQVYFHRVRRVYDKYLQKYFEALNEEEGKPKSIEEILKRNDFTMMSKILNAPDTEELESSKWAKRIRNRNHHKLIHETGINAKWKDLKLWPTLIKNIEDKYSSVELLHDRVQKDIHKLVVPDDPDSKGLIEMKMVDSNGVSLGEIGEHSQILRYVPRTYLSLSVYADCGSGGKDFHREVSKYAADQWRQLGGRA